MGARRTVGFQPRLPSDAPELEVQATTGKATPTDPLTPVVEVEADAEADDEVGVVEAGPISELPQPANRRPRAARAARAASWARTRPACCRFNPVSFCWIAIGPDVKPPPLVTGAFGGVAEAGEGGSVLWPGSVALRPMGLRVR